MSNNQTIKNLRVKNNETSVSQVLPIGADAVNVELANRRNLQETIGNIDSRVNGSITNNLEVLSSAVQTLDSIKADTAMIGSPLVAGTASQMIDTSHIYVYTGSESGYTAGNWYYHNGTNWVSGGVYNSTAVETDKTLKVENVAADSRAAGNMVLVSQTQPTAASNKIWIDPDAREIEIPTMDDLNELKDDLSHISGMSDDVKETLLACFQHVAWIDEHGQSYYDALYDALYADTPTPAFDYGIYVPDTIVTGKYIDTDGDVQTDSGTFYIDDYIPVVRSNYWIGMNPSSLRVPAPGTAPTNESNWRISEYDVSKNFIKQTHFDSSNDLCSSVLYDFDSNTKYIRLSWSDSNSSTNSKEFDIENPALITVLPVEIGNIDASTGQNSESTTRVRTAGYIPVSNTITITGCPFYDTWSEWISLWTSAGYSVDSFFYVVRCYDSSKAFLGTLTYNSSGTFRQDISNVTLPSGTAYIRMLLQTENYAALSITCVNHLITINGTKYYMEAVS